MQIMDRLHLEDLFTRAIQSDLHVKFDNCHYMCTWLDSNKMHIVIRDSFLFGVFNINIIASTPLQLFYVTKDHWIKVNENSEK